MATCSTPSLRASHSRSSTASARVTRKVDTSLSPGGVRGNASGHCNGLGRRVTGCLRSRSLRTRDLLEWRRGLSNPHPAPATAHLLCDFLLSVDHQVLLGSVLDPGHSAGYGDVQLHERWPAWHVFLIRCRVGWFTVIVVG